MIHLSIRLSSIFNPKTRSSLDVFYNKVACEGSNLRLKCRHSDQGIAVLSAFFGSTGHDVAECPPKSSSPTAASPVTRTDASRIQSDGAEGEDLKNQITNDLCQSSFATERLMSRCVGRGNCSVPADSSVLGAVSSCKPGTQLHAKATYACVSRQVLKGLFAGSTGSREDMGGSDHPGIPVDGGRDESSGSDPQERGNAESTGHRVTEDYSGFVDAPRYVPEQEQGSSSGRHEDADESGGSRRAAGASDDAFTQIRRMFRKEDQSREKAGPKSDATDDQAIPGIISRTAVQDSDTLSHQKLITQGVSFWVSMTSFIKGHKEQLMWYTFTCLSIAVLMGIILLLIMMFKKPSISNQQRKKLHPAPDVDAEFSTAAAAGKKSPPPPVMFDVSSDEILADLQAEGLVRSPTLVDYKHDDNNYGFLPAHAPLQTSFVGMDHHQHHGHHRVAQEGDHHQLEDGSFEITCATKLPHLHDYHQTHDTHHQQQLQHHIVYDTDFVSGCSQFPAGINLNLNLEHHNHSQFQPLLRLNHVHPILRSSQPHLHHLTTDVNDGCITDLQSASSQKQQQPSVSSLISSTHRRLFHTLGRNPSSASSSNNAAQRVSTIDRNSLFRDNHEKGSIFLNESTPPRAMAIDDENHYF